MSRTHRTFDDAQRYLIDHGSFRRTATTALQIWLVKVGEELEMFRAQQDYETVTAAEVLLAAIDDELEKRDGDTVEM
jgi:hypothetical protein